MFKYTLDNKRYHTLNYYYKNKYGKKVFKVALNAGFSCPNKVDGQGCIFCSRLGSGDFAGNKEDDLETQFYDVLKDKYEQVLQIPNVIGLNIATRPDAITDECYDYLEELNKRTDLTIEIGLQSIHEDTLKLINRGHDLACFDKCIKELKKRNIKTVVHIINGLPYETKEDMLETVKHLNELGIDGIKIHMLHIIKDTDLADMYKDKPFHVLTKDEYIDIVINQLELLDPKIVINRITGDPKKEDLIEPQWLLRKVALLDDIDKEMVRRDVYQGDKIKE